MRKINGNNLAQAATRKRRTWFFYLSNVLVVIMLVWLSWDFLKSHYRLQPAVSINTKEVFAARAHHIQPLFEGFELIGFDRGKKTFVLKAKQLCLRNREVKPFGFRIALGKSAELEDVSMTFYSNGEPVSTLHSNTALLEKDRNNVLFQGKPAMLTKSHRVLSAREIKWVNVSRSIQAQGNCFLSKDGASQYADAITTDIDLNNAALSERKNKIGFQI